MAKADRYSVLSEAFTFLTNKAPIKREGKETEQVATVIVEEIQNFQCTMKEKLLLMTVVKRLFQNYDLYLDICDELTRKGLFTYMMETITQAEDLYLLYTCKEAMIKVLVSPVVKEIDRCIILLCDTWNQADTKVLSKVTVLEIFLQLLSTISKMDCKSDLEEIVVDQLHSSWNQSVDRIFAFLKTKSTEDNYFYMIILFLKLWKKIVQVLHKRVDLAKSYIAYITTVEVLFQEVHTVATSNCRAFVGVLSAIFDKKSTDTKSDIQKLVISLAKKLLGLEREVIGHLMESDSTKGFLGCRNTAADCNQENVTCVPAVLKMYIRCCYSISCPPVAALGFKENTISAVCQCLDNLVSYFKKPLHHVVVDCFADQDDDHFQVSLDLLMIYLNLKYHHRQSDMSSQHAEDLNVDEICNNIINPHESFLLFLQHTNWDSSLLLDFIISPETCFLQYFTHYLKLVVNDWDFFMTVSKQFQGEQSLPSQCLSKFMHTQAKSLDGVSNQLDCTLENATDQSTEAKAEESTTERECNWSKNSYGADTATYSRMKDHLSVIDGLCWGDQHVDYSRVSVNQSSLGLCTNVPLVDYSDSSGSETEQTLTSVPGSGERSDGVLCEKFIGPNPALHTLKGVTEGCQETSKDLCDQTDEQNPSSKSVKHQFEQTNSDNFTDKDGYQHPSNDTLGSFMSVLIRLGLKLDRMQKYNLLTFNIAPLTQLIKRCEQLYEI